MEIESPPTPTLMDVARRLSMSESSVSRLRSGKRHPSLDTMVQVDKAYGWPLVEQVSVFASTTGGRHEWARRFRQLAFDTQDQKEKDSE